MRADPRRRRRLGSVAAIVMLAGTVVTPVPSAPVANAASPIVVGGACFFHNAIQAANTASTVGNCVYDGLRTIQVGVAPLSSVTGPSVGGASTALPLITSDITIVGGLGGAGRIYYEPIILPARPPRFAAVAETGSLTLRDVTISGFSIVGTTSSRLTPAGVVRGGAIHAEGPLTLERVVMEGNSATGGPSGWSDFNADTLLSPPHGADAFGGAIYATGDVVITDSVFHDNLVRGGSGVEQSLAGVGFEDRDDRDGGDGGDAFGADLALGPTATAVIDRTVFEGSVATGADGSYGTTPDLVKAGQFPGPVHGRDGICDVNNKPLASAGRGVDGFPGFDGADGGDGGSAVGVIAGGESVTIQRSSIVGARATAGGAGQAGVPGLGGTGGDAGDAARCLNVTNPQTGAFEDWDGLPAEPGAAGDHGRAGRWGERGFATATVETSRLTMVNTTISESNAEVRNDIVDPDFPNRDDRRQAVLVKNGRVGEYGLTAGGDKYMEPPLRIAGEISEDLVRFEQEASPGVANVLMGDPAASAAISFSTLARNDTILPGQGLRTSAPSRHVTRAGTRLLANVLYRMGPTTPCANAVSDGHNWAKDACPPAPALSDRSGLGAPVTEFSAPSGTIVTTDASGVDWRIRTHTPLDVNNGPLDRVPAPCTAGVSVVATDARTGARSDGWCDAGAHELNTVTADVSVTMAAEVVANPLAETATTADVLVELADPDLVTEFGSAGATVTIRLENFAGLVDYGDGDGPVPVTSRTFDLATTPRGTIPARTITLYPAGTVGINGGPLVRATLDPGASDPAPGAVLTDFAQGPIIYNSAYTVDFDGPTLIGRCSTITSTFTARSLGISRVRSRSATIFPGQNWVIPEITSTADRPSKVDVRPGSDFGVNGATGTPFFFAPRLTAGDNHPAEAQDVYRQFPQYTVLPEPVLDVSFEGLDAVTPGETREATAVLSSTNSAPCRDVVGVVLDVSAGAAGSSGSIDAHAVGALDGGATVRVPFTFTAPPTEGPVEIQSSVTMPGSDLVSAPFEFSTVIQVSDTPPSTTAPTTTEAPAPSSSTPAPTTTEPPSGRVIDQLPRTDRLVAAERRPHDS